MQKRNIKAKKAPQTNRSLKGLALLGVIFCILLGQSFGQLPNVREAIEDKRKNAGMPQQNPIEEISSESLASAKMYNQLLTFKYSPSQRDPFISSSVISPFVTEEEAVVVTADAEQINAAKRAIEGVVRNRIELSGIAFGKMGANYTIAYADEEKMIPQILRPGEYIIIDLGPEEQGVVDNAYKMALSAGAKLKIKVAEDRPALMLKILKIDGKNAEVENPTGEGSFSVEYRKRMIRTKGPLPKQVDK